LNDFISVRHCAACYFVDSQAYRVFNATLIMLEGIGDWPAVKMEMYFRLTTHHVVHYCSVAYCSVGTAAGDVE